MSLQPLPPALAARLPVWLAVPWVDRGASLAGWDCWGLVEVVSVEAFGRVLPPFAALVRSAHDKAAVGEAFGAALSDFAAVDPQPGAVALFRTLGHATHVGLHLSPRLVLHASARVGTVLTDLAHEPPWERRRVASFVYAGCVSGQGPARG